MSCAEDEEGGEREFVLPRVGKTLDMERASCYIMCMRHSYTYWDAVEEAVGRRSNPLVELKMQHTSGIVSHGMRNKRG